MLFDVFFYNVPFPCDKRGVQNDKARNHEASHVAAAHMLFRYSEHGVKGNIEGLDALTRPQVPKRSNKTC